MTMLVILEWLGAVAALLAIVALVVFISEHPSRVGKRPERFESPNGHSRSKVVPPVPCKKVESSKKRVESLKKVEPAKKKKVPEPAKKPVHERPKLRGMDI